MPVNEKHNALIGRFALWKVAAMELFLGVLAIAPMTRGFGNGLNFGSFFYTSLGFPLLVIACGSLALLFLVILPILWCAVLGWPAIEITASNVTMFSLPSRRLAAADIVQVADAKLGTSRISLRDGSQFSVPAFFYRNGDEVLRLLKKLAEKNAQRA